MMAYDDTMRMKIVDEGDTPLVEQHFDDVQVQLDEALHVLQMNSRPLHKDGTVTVTVTELMELAEWIDGLKETISKIR